MTVTGAGFAFSQALGCRFGLVDARASFVSATEIVCVAPEVFEAGDVPLAVANNGADFFAAADGARFAFDAPVVVDAVAPRAGGVGGGTVVTVRAAVLRTRGALCLACS